jgi:hypothetical protein
MGYGTSLDQIGPLHTLTCVDPKFLRDKVYLWGRSSLLDRLNRRLNDDSRSGHARLRQVKEREHVKLHYKERLESKLPFIFRSHILLGPMIRFLGYKYQRLSIIVRRYTIKIKNLFGFGHKLKE